MNDLTSSVQNGSRPPLDTSDTQSFLLSIVHCRTSFSVWVMFSRMLSFKASMVRDFSPFHPLIQVAPKKKTMRCQVWRSRGPQVLWYDSVLQCSTDLLDENESHSAPSVEAAANYSGTAPAWTALFPKQVPSASDHSFKNYRQNVQGVLYELLSCVGAVTVIFLRVIITKT